MTPVARDIVRRVPRTQVWIVDRREQAFEDTSVFERRDPDAALDYYLGFKYHSVKGADAKYVADWGLKTQLRTCARGAPGQRRRAAQRDPGRPLGGRLDGRGLRRLGLQRAPGLPGDRRAGADRRRAAGQLRRRRPRARQERAGRHPQGQRVPRPARLRDPRDRGHLHPGRRAVRDRAPRRGLDAPDVPAATRRVQAELPGHQRGAARLRVRREHLAEGARADPHPCRPPRRQRQPARLGRRRAYADPALRAGLRGQRPERDRVVLPAPAAARHRRAPTTSSRRRPRATSACG